MNKNIKKIILLSIIPILGVGIYLGNKKLKDEKRWIYSTGTDEVVFGEITWGMSKQEVERSLGYKLFTPEQYKTSNEVKSLYKRETRSYLSKLVIYQNCYLPNYDSIPELIIPQNINKNSVFLVGKPLPTFLGVNTGGVVYLFYKNRLFSVEILPFLIFHEYERNDFYTLKSKFEKSLFKNLNSKFGRLIIKKDSIFHSTQISNKVPKNVFLDCSLNFGTPKSIDGLDILLIGDLIKDKYYISGYLELRYRPIIQEINKDLKESEISFFK
jgi:hypothetical protein